MERRKALGVAGATTLVAGAAVVAAAAIGGATLLGFGGSAHGPGSYTATPVAEKKVVQPKTVTRTLYDDYVVDAPTPAASSGPAGQVAPVADTGVAPAPPPDDHASPDDGEHATPTQPAPPREEPEPDPELEPEPEATTTTVAGPTTTVPCEVHDDHTHSDSSRCNGGEVDD